MYCIILYHARVHIHIHSYRASWCCARATCAPHGVLSLSFLLAHANGVKSICTTMTRTGINAVCTHMWLYIVYTEVGFVNRHTFACVTYTR